MCMLQMPTPLAQHVVSVVSDHVARGKDATKQQAASSSNVGGEKLCVLNGGLNYQIEHHLFPRIAHSHYPRISEKVRPFVTSKGGQYIHFDTVWDNLSSVHKYLKRFSDPLFNPVVKGPARPVHPLRHGLGQLEFGAQIS